jgi:hypothetical protein
MKFLNLEAKTMRKAAVENSLTVEGSLPGPSQTFSDKAIKIEPAASLADTDRIGNFLEFINSYESKTPQRIKNVWNRFKVVVDKDMKVIVFSDQEDEPKHPEWILPNAKLERWSQLQRILDYFRAKPYSLPKPSTTNQESSSVVFETVKVEPPEKPEIFFVEGDEPIELKVEENIQEPEDQEAPEVEDKPTPKNQEDFEPMDDDANDVDYKVQPGDSSEDSSDSSDSFDKYFEGDEEKKERLRMKKREDHLRRKRRRQEGISDEPKVKMSMFVDCPNCDRKNLTREQLKNHYHSQHVSRSWFCPLLGFYVFDYFSAVHSGAINAESR